MSDLEPTFRQRNNLIVRSFFERLWPAWAVLLLFTRGGLAQAQSDPLPLEVHTLAAQSVAVPVEHDFAISLAGSYKVTLTDLGAPAAPLSSVKLVVTKGTTVVGTALTAAGPTSFDATPGNYSLHVVGKPGSNTGSGPIGMTVTAADTTKIAEFSDVLALPAQPITGAEGVTDGTFTVTGADCQCKISLRDLSFPQNLQTLLLTVIAQGGSQILASLDSSGTTETTVTLPAGTYRIFAVGLASSTASGGLFSQSVVSTADNTVLYQRNQAIGAVTSVDALSVPAGSYTLALSDLAFPAGSALAQLAATVVSGGQSVALQTMSGTSPAFTATAGTYEVFALAVPATGGAGSYSLQLQAAGAAPVLSVARTTIGQNGPMSGYDFEATIPTAGAYTATVTDFQFPSPLTTVAAALVQGGTIVGTPINAAGTISVANATAGPVSLVVFAQATSSGGLVGAEVAPSAGGAAVLDITQGIGSAFVGRKISVLTPGNYAVTAADLGFPAAFANFDVVVTQGVTRVGSIYTSGTFVFPATAGNYTVNFIAQPTGTDQAGTYALQVSAAPPSPTLTLTADKTSVPSGGTVNLTWSSTDATTCVASGSWTGAQQVSGTFKSGSLASASTFTLQCTGVSGSITKSVAVSIDPPSSGGGGGRLDLALLAFLTGLLCMSLWPEISRRPRV